MDELTAWGIALFVALLVIAGLRALLQAFSTPSHPGAGEP